MTLDDKIRQSIDREMSRMLDLFQATNDVPQDLSDLKRLVRSLPLIQDIKTEVKDIQNKIDQIYQNQPKDKDEEDKPEKQQDDDRTPQEKHDDSRILKLLEEAERHFRKIPPQSIESPDGLMPTDPEQDSLPEKIVKGTPGYDALNTLYKAWKVGQELGRQFVEEYKRTLNQKDHKDEAARQSIRQKFDKKLQDLSDIIDAAQSDLIDDIQEQANQLDDLINEKTQDIKDDINDSTSSVRQDIFHIGENMSNGFDNASQQLNSCCNNMSQAMDGVQSDLSKLQPNALANQSLGLLGKINATRSQINDLRRLL